MALLLKKVERPRELNWYQASSMLYGDWGTSKAYVLGLAFALAGHASMFFLLAMNVLVIVVGLCYIVICKAYPDGGGVYSAVRSRSQVFAVIGALLLVADYVVTAALSSLDAFHYLGLQHPELWAVAALVAIGLMNIVGPRSSGNIATIIAVSTVLTLITLSVFVFPHIIDIKISAPKGSFFSNWTSFVGIVLALSGVEAIANATGIMHHPVEKTARRAIMPVLIEVTVITLILGAAMNSIPGLEGHTEDMIRKIGEYYVGPWFGQLIAIVLAFLLLSACNTAIMDLVSITFLMSKDRELPKIFNRLNRYGMPWFGLLVATAAPIVVLMVEHDITHLAALYAIGVVGAISINLTACCTNFEIAIKKHERVLLACAAIVMLFIEATIIYQKHNAVIFASCVLVVGLSARFAAKRYEKARLAVPATELGINVLTVEEARDLMPLYKSSILLAVKSTNARLVEEAAKRIEIGQEGVVYVLYVEEKPPGWAYPTEVEPARSSVEVLKMTMVEFEKHGIMAVPLWSFGENAGALIVKTARELNLDTIIIGATKRGAIEKIMRGEVVKTVNEQLPRDKKLVIC